MKTFHKILMLVTLTASGLWAAQPYGRACLTVVDQQATSKNPQGSEQVFAAGFQPGEGRQLKLYLDANSSCLALIAVFERNSERPANNWWPRLVEVAPWEEKTLPPPAKKWDWTKGSSEFDFFVIFLEKESPQAGELKKLVEGMKESPEDSGLLKRQSRKLKDTINQWLSQSSRIPAQGGSTPPLLAGVVRSPGEFPWREACRKIEFGKDQMGILVFGRESAKKD